MTGWADAVFIICKQVPLNQVYGFTRDVKTNPSLRQEVADLKAVFFHTFPMTVYVKFPQSLCSVFQTGAFV